MPEITSSLVTVRSKEELIAYIAEGNKVKYLFFWGHTTKDNSFVDKECLSQWYEAGFDIDGIHYSTAEHYMMAEKARLFNDKETLEKVLNSKHPGDAKKIGRTVRGYQEDVWKKIVLKLLCLGIKQSFCKIKS